MTALPEREVPASRRAGRAAGRWWRRHGPTVIRLSRPVRGGWAVVAAYAWFLGYVWVGLVLAAAAVRLSGGDGGTAAGSGVASWIIGVGGGVVLGAWQARHRLRRHRVPGTPPLDRVGLALLVWIGLLAVTIWLQT